MTRDQFIKEHTEQHHTKRKFIADVDALLNEQKDNIKRPTQNDIEFIVDDYDSLVQLTDKKQMHCILPEHYAEMSEQIFNILKPNSTVQPNQSVEEFMKENGLGPEDMINDITYPAD